MRKILAFSGFLILATGAFFFGSRQPSPLTPLPEGEGNRALPTASVADIPRVPPVQPQKVTVLTYHSVEPKPNHKEGVMQRHYRILPENFEKQMQYLKDAGYQTITFAQLTDYLSYGTPIPEKAIVLTFDDGWKSQYDNAVPVLKKYGFTATFFIITKSGRGGGYMTWDEVRDLHASGFEIGSHTETHPKLVTLDDARLAGELEGSRRTLESEIGSVVTTLAYPYYGHDDRVMQAAQKAGYAAARAGWTKFENSHEHLFEISSQEPVDDPNPFATKIKK